MADTRKFRPVRVNEHDTVRIYNNSGSDLSAGDPVYIDGSGNVAVCADNNTVGIHGVCVSDIEAGGYGVIYIDGVFEVDVDGTVDFALGEEVYTSTGSKVDKGSTGDVCVGYVVEADPSNGASTVRIVIASKFRSTVTHA